MKFYYVGYCCFLEYIHTSNVLVALLNKCVKF